MDDGVGGKLREARRRRRLSLQEVEEATKIRGRYLQAIEDDAWDQLPGETYTRAFIRTYAAFVGLDGDRLAEEERRARGAPRPGERLPQVAPKPRRVARRSPRRQVPPRLLTAAILALVAAALIAIGLTGGGEDGPSSAGGPALGQARAVSPSSGAERAEAGAAGHSLTLTATGEVWVCLLDANGSPLVDGRILVDGETEGPFRSGSFTLALGNGAVKMTVDGQQANVAHPSSPTGFTVDAAGSVRELPEGERPTCT